MALFTKGQSGNPSGRKPGSRNQVNIMKDALKSYNQANNTNAVERIIHQLIDKAIDEGDMNAAKLILERSVANIKPISAPVTLPAGIPTDLFAKGEKIISLCECGEISPDIAKELLSSITMLLKVKESTELEKRLAALEQEKVRV
jgi:polyhydroxyalkanoate synthesis regulator phasin